MGGSPGIVKLQRQKVCPMEEGALSPDRHDAAAPAPRIGGCAFSDKRKRYFPRMRSVRPPTRTNKALRPLRSADRAASKIAHPIRVWPWERSAVGPARAIAQSLTTDIADSTDRKTRDGKRARLGQDGPELAAGALRGVQTRVFCSHLSGFIRVIREIRG